MNSYIIYHVRYCKQDSCCLKFHQFSMKKNDIKTKNVLMIFMKDELSALARKYLILHDYLIHNFFDKTVEITKYFDENNFFHQREHHRFFEDLKLAQKRK